MFGSRYTHMQIPVLFCVIIATFGQLSALIIYSYSYYLRRF